MGLWYYNHWDTEKPYSRANWEKDFLGLDVYLICPGPSLAALAPQLQQRLPGVMRLGVNTSYPTVVPDLWVGQDLPVCFDPSLWWQPFPKVTDFENRIELTNGVPIRECPQTFFADLDHKADVSGIVWRRGDDPAFVTNHNTFWMALHLALWQGARRIHLVGCDLSNEKADYHDGRKLDQENHNENAGIYKGILRDLPLVATEAEKRYCSIVSCTPGSPANDVLGYVPLDEALRLSAARVPRGGGPVVDSSDAEACTWTPKAECPVEIVLCVHRDQEDLIPHWWACYRQFHDWPVRFVQVGPLGEEGKRFCEEHGELESVARTGYDGWSRKPMALLRGRGKISVLMDIDCEVRGDLTPIIDLARAGKVAIRRNYTPFMKDGTTLEVNTGLVACRHGAPLIQEWAARCATGRDSRYNDQHVMSFHLRDVGLDRVALIPAEQVTYLRDDYSGEGTAKTLVFHWIGSDGKQMLRERVAKPKTEDAWGGDGSWSRRWEACAAALPTEMTMVLAAVA